MLCPIQLSTLYSRFPPRHNALGPKDVRSMLETCNASSVDDLMDSAIPKTLPRLDKMNLGKMYTEGMTEAAFLEHFKCAPLLLNYPIAACFSYDTLRCARAYSM